MQTQDDHRLFYWGHCCIVLSIIIMIIIIIIIVLKIIHRREGWALALKPPQLPGRLHAPAGVAKP